jgi:hypothetical protein
MMDMGKHFDVWSFLVIALTLVLFVAALFTKGFTHDLLLEAGVFLVSVKLILTAYRNSVVNNAIQQKLEEIRSTVQRLGDAHASPHARQLIGHDRPMSKVSDQPGG